MPAIINSIQPNTLIIGLFILLIFSFATAALIFWVSLKHERKNKQSIASLTDRLNNTKAELYQLNQKYVTSGVADTFAGFFQDIGFPALIFDDKGNIYNVNQKFLDLTGYTLPELLLTNPEPIIGQSHVSPRLTMAYIIETINNQKPLETDCIIISKSGDQYPVKGMLIPYEIAGTRRLFYLFNEASTQYASEAETINKINNLTQNINDLQAKIAISGIATDVISSAPCMMVVINSQAQILMMNQTAEQFFETTTIEATGKSWNEIINLVNQEGHPQIESINQAFLGKRTKIPKWTFINVRKGKIPIWGQVAPYNTINHTGGIVFSFYDASDEYKEEIEEKAFFSGAAHDLRTPITSIRGFVELIIGKPEAYSKEQITDMLKQVNSSVLNLITLVNDLLNVSRIEMGRVQLTKESFDIVSLTQEVIDSQMEQAKAKQLSLTHKIDEVGIPKVSGDKTKTQEVLQNLISNAIKYTQEGEITVSHFPEGAIMSTIVADTGMGISPANQGLLFKKFQQIGISRTMSITKSTGLGLYIAKKFTQLMGGDLTLVKSEPQQGSTFKFTLPIAPLNT
jgi:PAS domain S-box-containing protein